MGRQLLLLLLFLLILIQPSSGWRRRRRRRWCPRTNCRVSNWSGWSSCSHSCGPVGTQRRTRSVISIAKCGGSCYHLSESRLCNRVCCPRNCRWHWGSWGACQGCGTGTRSRVMVISTRPYCGGSSCPSTRRQTTYCSTGRCCPVNCVVSSWRRWGSCSALCERPGSRIKTRRITTRASCNGKPCPSLIQRDFCFGPCCPRDCLLSKWTSWSKCNAPAGYCGRNSGTQRRSRKIVTIQSCGGRCYPLQATQQCTPVPLQCQVSKWGSWSPCTPNTGTCGAGTQSRTMTIMRQPYCAPACPATSSTRNCVHSCCPVSCVLSQWSSWGSCSANCGTGSQVRTRRIISQASCGGSCSSVLSQRQSCTVIQKIDCQLSSWSSWSTCSSGCGNGLQQRSRRIIRQPTSCGIQCGSLTETRQCTSYRDNRDCQVGTWTGWGSCDTKCSVGTKTRSRSVIVTKRCNGTACPALTDSTACGLPNGGCEQQCQTSNGTCYCMPGYLLTNRTHCTRKDCGPPTIDYCPPGKPNGTECKQPRVACPRGASEYETVCSVSCPPKYRLVGRASIRCESDGGWTDGYNTIYCERINDPPSDIILSGSHSLAENEAAGTVIGNLSSIDPNSKDSHNYTLISDASYQGKFMINDTELLAIVTFDFETDSKSFLVGIRSTDDGNPSLSFTKYFTIRIVDVNEKPTNLVISSTSVAENSDIGTAVGTFDTIDVDLNQTDNYRLLNSANGIFRVNSNILEVARPNGNCLVSGSTNCPLNFESERSYTIEVESYDDKTPSFTITQSFNISVTDRNDPPYNIRLSGNTVKEDAPQGTFIGQFSAEDEDENPKQTLSFSLVDDDGGRFAVSSSGMLTKVKETDYETDKLHKIQVRVTDSGTPPLSIAKDFIIIIEDVNESPMKIEFVPKGGQLSFPKNAARINENSPVGTVVGTLVAYDEDAIERLSFSLDDDAKGSFMVDSSSSCSNTTVNGSSRQTVCSVQLKVSGALDYEKDASRSIVVRATDSKGLHHSQMFTISLVDQNDQPTDITLNGLHRGLVNENENNALIGTLETQDEDSKQRHSYRITNDPGMNFIISHEQLYTSPRADLNYEEKNLYTITVETTDNGSPAMSYQRNLTVQVLDVNEAPTSLSLSSNQVDENSPIGKAIGNISVVDPDNEGKFIGRQRASCRVIVDTSNMLFDVNGDTTLVVKRSNLDFERQSSYTLKLRCTDNGVPRKSLEQEVTVNVNDINERPSGITLTSGTVSENQGPVLVGKLLVSDPDRTPQRFTLSITDRSLPFNVIGNTLRTTKTLNFEQQQVYRISIKAIDQGGLSFVDNFTINVQDTNDAPSDILFFGSLSIQENSPAGSPVGTAFVVDEDFFQIHTYAINNVVGERYRAAALFTPVSGYFTIEPASGRIQTAVSNIDYEEYTSFNITVMATDNGIPPQSIRKTTKIKVVDVNYPPTDLTFNGRSVTENSPIGTVVGNFTITDPDNRLLQTQLYSCRVETTAGGDSVPFTISNRLSLTVSGEVNYEKKQLYSLKVTCTEEVPNPYNITKTFILKVVNVNEAPGGISITSNSIAENLDPGSVVGRVYAVDPDNELTFVNNVTITLLSELDFAAFSLVDGNYLVTNRRFNYEQKSTFSIKILATDNGIPALSSTQILDIKIEDMNERPTSISLSSNTISENSPEGSIIGSLSTTDEDSGQTHSYSIITTIDNLQIRGRHLIVSGKLDYETESRICIEISVTDSGNPPLSYQKSFNISVTDANDPPSDIRFTLYPVAENNTENQIVANLTIVDEDLDKQVRICSVINNPGYFYFAKDAFSNAINMFIRGTAPLDYEAAPVINATVQCFDNGSPFLSVTKKLSIPILDSNDAPTSVLINGSDVTQLKENSPVEAVVGRLSCLDQDASQSHVYSLQSNGDVFMINENSEILRVKNSSQLNYEALPPSKRMPVRIKVTDNGQPAMSYTGTVQIEITDVNEAPSNVRIMYTNGETIPENLTIGAFIGELHADNPEGFRQNLTFEVLNGQDTFAVTESHGPGKVSYLTVKKELNYDVINRYNLSIKVTDNGTPPLSVQGIITIDINPTDPCASGSLDCGTEICQRINKTHGNCGCLDGYTPKEGVCVQVNDCKANCLYCDDSKTACQTEVQCLPCDNNATCHDQLKSYKCVCLPGFSDERCKTNIDDCASKPCQHGTCFDLVNKYRCECEKGYEGRNCTDNINECNRKECVKGDCTDLIDGFSCSCTKGALGLLCNRRESDCSPNKCGTNVCVAPAYKDSKSLDEGGLEVICASTDQVISLAFSSSSVPDKKEEQAKWKYLLRQFITDLVSIPYYAVDLSEDKSNGGFYAPTDVVFYPFKVSKAKGDTKETARKVILPLVVKVQNKLVPQDSFFRAINKTCARIQQSSPYWVFCSTAYTRIKDLGISADPGKKTNADTPSSGSKSKNIYSLIGGGAGLLFIIMIALVVRARRRSNRNNKLRDYITHVMKESGCSYYEAMERHRAETSERDHLVFHNPGYNSVCLHGESVNYSKEEPQSATRWPIEVPLKENIDSDF